MIGKMYIPQRTNDDILEQVRVRPACMSREEEQNNGLGDRKGGRSTRGGDSMSTMPLTQYKTMAHGSMRKHTNIFLLQIQSVANEQNG
jgi:hypothetical protein